MLSPAACRGGGPLKTKKIRLAEPILGIYSMIGCWVVVLVWAWVGFGLVLWGWGVGWCVVWVGCLGWAYALSVLGWCVGGVGLAGWVGFGPWAC